MKFYSHGGFAGRVQTSRARSTGAQISLYHAEQAGLCPGGGPWATVCEDHGAILNHESLKLARQWVSAPEEWCEECREKLK